MTRYIRAVIALLAVAALFISPTSALSIKEYKKFSADQQSMYLIGAVSMTAYTFASNGETAKARCIQDWYFGRKKGDEAPGPRQLAVELNAAEHIDAEKFHVEGVVLGLTDKMCGTGSPKP